MTMYKTFLNKPNLTNEIKYKKCYRNKLNHIIKLAKQTFCEVKFDSVKDNIKSAWKLINKLINQKKGKQKISEKFKDNEKSIHACT